MQADHPIARAVAIWKGRNPGKTVNDFAREVTGFASADSLRKILRGDNVLTYEKAVAIADVLRCTPGRVLDTHADLLRRAS